MLADNVTFFTITYKITKRIAEESRDFEVCKIARLPLPVPEDKIYKKS